MNRSPFFSIITVTYNSNDSLKKTIQSINSQSFRDYEYIIIDGGSTDGTKKTLSSNKKGISKWVSEKDNGIYDAMNKGVKMAKGEYIYFLNAGDSFCSRDVLKNVKAAIETDNSPLVHGNILATRNGKKLGMRIKKRISPLSLRLGKKLIHQSFFMKTSLLKAAEGFNLKYVFCADYDLLCRLSTVGTKMKYIPVDIAYFDLAGFSSNIKETYRENYFIVKENFGFFWAVLYKFTSTLKYFISKLLLTLFPVSKVDKLRKLGI